MGLHARVLPEWGAHNENEQEAVADFNDLQLA